MESSSGSILESFEGAAKTFSKPASAYLPAAQTTSSTDAPEPGHPLKAVIQGTFQWSGTQLPVEVRFETSATPQGAYSYTLVNKGGGDLQFEMRALTTFLSRRNLLEKAVASSSWKPVDASAQRFRMQGEQTLRVQVGGSRPVENSSDLTLYAPDGKTTLARATVSVWEPAVR